MQHPPQPPPPRPAPHTAIPHPHPTCLIPGLRPPPEPPHPAAQPLFTPHTPGPHHAAPRAAHIATLLQTHRALLVQHAALQQQHRRLSQAHTDALNPGRAPAIVVAGAQPLFDGVGLVGWLEGVADGLERLLDEVNAVGARVRAVWEEVVVVEGVLRGLRVEVVREGGSGAGVVGVI
ncbi:hypothetical protein DFP73DRAFT_613571 [Morchella snyderi]|nr:hypothetical protein DFP73DRAFT_613571 [Morchella snyderi]